MHFAICSGAPRTYLLRQVHWPEGPGSLSCSLARDLAGQTYRNTIIVARSRDGRACMVLDFHIGKNEGCQNPIVPR
jgi:hypothetical protein